MNRTVKLRQTTMLSMLLIFSGITAHAERISQEDAAEIARRFLYPVNKSMSASGHDAPVMEVDGVAATDAYYVFSTQKTGNGFVIVSADDSLEPIVGYSTDGKYDADNLPSGLQAYLSDYSRVAAAISSGKIAYRGATKGGEAVAPLLKVKWNQMEPYNRLTPIRDGHAPTGCVATAVAQVMKHYEFPPAGHGVAGEFNMYNPDQKVQLGHYYDWDNMLDNYVGDGAGSGNYTDVQAEAVATLMRDIGYAINMDYGYYESSAQSSSVITAMVRNFNYSTDIKYAFRTSYSTQKWVDEIRAGLLSGSPVIYAGSDGRSGHEFVCDGIDTNDMLHINWGWGGYGDGYFDMNILSPEYLGTGAGSGAYYRDQDIVTNIHPGDPYADNSAWVAPLTLININLYNEVESDGKLKDGLNVGFGLFNTTGEKINAYTYAFGLVIKDASGQQVARSSYFNSHSGDINVCYYRNMSATCDIAPLIADGLLADGHYTASLIAVPFDKQEDAVAADALPVYIGDLGNIGFTVKEGEAYLDDPSRASGSSIPRLQMSDFSVAGGKAVYVGTDSEYTVTLENVSSALYNGYCHLYFIPEEEDGPEVNLDNYNSYASADVFLYPNVKAEVTLKGWNTPDKPGHYRVYMIADGSSGVVSCTAPAYVDFITLPDNEISMISGLRLDRTEYPRNGFIRFEISFSYNNPFYTSYGVELWAHGKDNPDREILVAKFPDSRISGGGRQLVEDWTFCELDALWYEDFGEYEAYIKYVDADGKATRMSGEGNSAKFTLVECDEENQAVLVSPVVFNGGKPVPAIDWSTFDVEFEIMTPTGMSMVPNETYVDIYRSPRGDDWVYSFVVNSISVDKAELAPGETTKVRINYMYRKVENEADLIGSTLYMRINYFKTPDSNCRMHPGKYEDTMNFRLVDPGMVGIDDVEADTGEMSPVVEYYRIDGSKIGNPSTPGIYIGRRADGTSTKVLIQ